MAFQIEISKKCQVVLLMENAFHFLHFGKTKWNFLIDALNVYRFSFQASSSFYQWLLFLFKSFLTVARSYLFNIFLTFLYSLSFRHVQNITFLDIYIFRYMRLAMLCSMSASALCCHAHALILKHWSTPHLFFFFTSGIVFSCVSV